LQRHGNPNSTFAESWARRYWPFATDDGSEYRLSGELLTWPSAAADCACSE
jgi:hypothetical protein